MTSPTSWWEELGPAGQRLLASNVPAVLGFLDDKGAPRSSPVWLEASPEEVRISSAPGTRKASRIKRDGRVSLCVSALSAPYEYVSITGDAVVEILPAAQRQLMIARLAARYLPVESSERMVETSDHAGDGELIRVTPLHAHYTLVG